MKNAVYRFGDRTSYKTIKQTTESVPAVRDHEVLVEIHGVTLNYRDLAISKSEYPSTVTEHVVPCSDGAGVVVSVGSAVEDIDVGDRVITNFDVTNLYGPVLNGGSHRLGGVLDGMLRQYAAVPAQAVIKIPEECTLDFVQLASLVCAGVTAWNALYGLAPLRPGQVVLLQGTGGVSIFGLQLAKAAGAVTIITSSSDEKLKFVKEKFGASYTINYRTTPDWAAEAKRITNGKGVDFVVENGGSGTIAQSIDAVAPGGQIGLIGFLARATQENMPDVAGLVLGKGCIIRGVQIGSKQLMEDLVRVVVSQNIQPHIYKTFGFDEEGVQAAFKCLESAGHIGKIGIDVKAAQN
uniref:Enoyl reductase (ER) domain-containing protein n=1 Tax=Phytophthora ramorum TaxID=164328 RepID=H3G9G2_PHYRM